MKLMGYCRFKHSALPVVVESRIRTRLGNQRFLFNLKVKGFFYFVLCADFLSIQKLNQVRRKFKNLLKKR